VSDAAPPRLREGIEAVVIGGSAGAVQALSVLLPALPAAAAAAVFIVLHLPRDKPSMLSGVFAHKCRLAVREAEDKEAVVPGTVYFAPANYHLLVDREAPAPHPHLALSVDEPVHHSRPSIDVLFESAALVYRRHLLGIILTGANDDGAEGLAAVRDAGGVTVVEDPQTAQAPQMVLAALQTGAPDHVLPVEGIAHLLSTIRTVPRTPVHR
jgi:two-component system chemotaxis response regulator CheB